MLEIELFLWTLTYKKQNKKLALSENTPIQPQKIEKFIKHELIIDLNYFIVNNRIIWCPQKFRPIRC